MILTEKEVARLMESEYPPVLKMKETIERAVALLDRFKLLGDGGTDLTVFDDLDAFLKEYRR